MWPCTARRRIEELGGLLNFVACRVKCIDDAGDVSVWPALRPFFSCGRNLFLAFIFSVGEGASRYPAN